MFVYLPLAPSEERPSLVKEGEESFKSGNKAYISTSSQDDARCQTIFHNGDLTRQSEGHVALIKALAQEQISASLTYREKQGKITTLHFTV